MGLTGLVALIIASGAATALAYWAGSGTGSATASAGTLQTVSVVAVAGESPGSTLVPEGPAADVVLKIDNPNPFSVTLVAVSLAGAVTASNGCGPTGVGLATATNLPLSVPPGTSVIHLASAATMDGTSASGCQGATFSFPIAITVHR